MSRTSIIDFSIANSAYGLSTITVYTANPDGSKGALATLYAGQTGPATLPNPQVLDATGKWTQPIYIDADVILEIDSASVSLDGDTGIVSFGGSWRGTYVAGGTKYYRGDRILGPAATAEEDNVYISQSIWTSTNWAADVANLEKMELEVDFQALRTLALGALPDADEVTKGKIEIATQAETNAGADDTRAITPLKLQNRTATETRAGIAEVATQTETNTGANDTTMVTPAKLHARASSETLSGLIAIASQAEVNAGSEDTKAITAARAMARTNYTPGFIFGLAMNTNAVDATNDIDIAVGAARAADDSFTMVLSGALTKRLDANWVVGTGNGGLDTGAVANGTYHVWLIRRPDTGNVDVLFSLSASAPTMPGAYTQKRRIGSIIRTGGVNLGFRTFGDQFKLFVQQSESTATADLAATLVAHTAIPAGIRVAPIIHIRMSANAVSVNSVFLLGDGDGSGTVAAVSRIITGASDGGGNVDVIVPPVYWTNLSRQLWWQRTNSATVMGTFNLDTIGWVDRRGQDGGL